MARNVNQEVSPRVIRLNSRLWRAVALQLVLYGGNTCRTTFGEVQLFQELTQASVAVAT